MVMKADKILIVEDDKNIAKLVKYNLEKAGFSCTTTITGEDALDLLDREPFGLVILDIMLPKMNGLEVCKAIKQEENLSGMPIIMLTAKGEEVDRVVGFELGADDYVVKPFSPRELVLRVKAVLKRKEPKSSSKDKLSAGKISVDITRYKVTVNNKAVELTPMEFRLLATLMERIGRVQSREKLLEDVWGITADVTTRTVDTHIKRLRKSLGKSGRWIETVRSIGYRFSEEAK
jgi:DNA-binding response OmpR family regulator